MNFNHLKYFKTLAEEQNYTKAAKKLYISQPSLSNTIKNLENNLGFALFERTTRNLYLTAEGKTLYREVKQLINHFDYVINEIDRLKEHGPDELAIGIIESINFWIADILYQFKQEYEHVQIRLYELLSARDVIKSLNDFEIYFSITNQYIMDESIQTFPLYKEELIGLIPSHYYFDGSLPIQLRDVKDIPLIICREGFQSRFDILTAFKKEGIHPTIEYEIERFETAQRMVDMGLGFTIMPENYVSEQTGANYYIKKINNPNLTRTIYLAYLRDRYFPPLVYYFIELVKQHFNISKIE